jgi:hypothetical protein
VTGVALEHSLQQTRNVVDSGFVRLRDEGAHDISCGSMLGDAHPSKISFLDFGRSKLWPSCASKQYKKKPYKKLLHMIFLNSNQMEQLKHILLLI